MGETPAGTPGPPPHHHENLSEVFIVTEGQMDFVVNGDKKTIKAGEVVDLPVNTIHTFGNNSDQPCKWINIHSPKGFWSFFKDMGIDSNEENAVMKSVDESIINKVMATAADYDMLIDV